MAEQKRYPHIFLKDTHETTQFTSPKSFPSKVNLPFRNREKHSKKLRRALDTAWRQARLLNKHRKAVALPTRDGVYLEFQGKADYDVVIRSLEDRRSKIRLLNVREEKDKETQKVTTYATVYIPTDKRKTFLNKIRQYADPNEDTDKGRPRNGPLIEGIEHLRLAVLESFWRDDEKDLIPGETTAAWCEAWLLHENDDTEHQFRALARQLKIDCDEGTLTFPERLVMLIQANRRQLTELIEASPHIAEFRRAKETALYWIELPNAEQTQWVRDLASRLSVDERTKVSVCVLDTGVNNGHELLQPILSDDDCQAFHPDWGVNDHNSHGTLISGLAAYGDLQKALDSKQTVTLAHKLESVKILPSGDKQNDSELYGHITQQAISLAEIQAPDRSRIICMAITAKDKRDRGRPSSWSGAIDAVTSGYNDPNEQRRLFIVCAGNVDEPDDWKDYPNSNLTDSIHDPGQSWNALVVGAYTEKTRLTDADLKDHHPIASKSGLSPFSTTSYIWENRRWPAKPDVVMEGGNVAISPGGEPTECEDLSLLSTYHLPSVRQFSSINATSAACAQAAWMAAQIQTAYPEAWPETIRGLIVHSADWTEQMKQDFLDHPEKCIKTEFADLLRICGYGVPDLARARECAANSLTLIAQETLQPFEKNKGKSPHAKDMHIHEIPWPVEVLRDLGETEIKLRITLSYFVEPGPGEVGWKDRYRYPSHALRFDLISPNETPEQFRIRINKAAREDGEKSDTSSRTDRWTIGSNGRDLGSIHSDIWTGTAADIAECHYVGIYPVTGWWKERHYLGFCNKQARYSLIVSISTPEQAVDLYTPVAVKLKVPIEI